MSWCRLRSVFCLENFSWFSRGQGLTDQRSRTSNGGSDSFSHPYLPLITHDKKTAMREVQLGSHTLRSHGVKVARTHKHDWLILLLLAGIIAALNFIHPFYRFVGKDMMDDLKYPHKSNTVPFWVVPMYADVLPIFIFLIFYFYRRDVYDLHHAILGLLFSTLGTTVITDAIKDAVGRPRPDFFWRCFPDGKDVYDKWGNVICSGAKNIIKEGHKSFPSGHTSCFAVSFAGLGFLSLYLAGKIKAFDCRGHVAKLCLVWLPLLAAALVGISRVDDYRHHWQDVFAGGLLGYVVALFCYLQFFPPPHHVRGWATYAYFRAMDECGGTTPVNNGAGSLEAGVDNQETKRSDEAEAEAFMEIALADDRHSHSEDMKSGGGRHS
ncbi:lipid phosphate phosphatase 2-like isoform X1 [Ipomoea triloba]|uniref:lipid phosphate phosphatase 2-like isoform X1 n=2 Tax=Ipomoea triloba TaxID=35885 RepID=UPI00125CE635|nr:lipid phosphate phosphatase 2-like isoform X1 [Ipomoea triloba]